MRLRRRVWAAAALFATAAALLATVGVTLDASRWRPRLAERLAGTLGRPVALDGPVHVVVSLSPRLRAERVRLPNPPGFAASDLLSVGELHVQADLWPLLAGQTRVRELIARGVTLRLDRDAQGRGNWSRPPAPAADRDAAGGLARLDLHRLVVERAVVEYGGAERPRRAEIAELTAEARAGRAARVELKGAWGGSGYTLALSGAPLDRLGTSEAWPLTIDGRLGSARVRGEGRISGPLAQPEAELRFDIDAPDAVAIGAALAAPAPPLGAVAAAGSLHLTAGRAALRGFRLNAGQSALSGDLDLDWSGVRPRLTGALDSPRIDVLPFLADRGRAPRTLAELLRENESVEVDLRALGALEADVRVAVARWLNLPGEIRDSALRVQSEDGAVRVPLEATVAGARFTGEIASTPAPGLRARLETIDAPLGGLAELFVDAPYLDGRLGRFSLRLDARGTRVGELLRGLELEAALEEARFSYGNYPGGAPVRMAIDRADLKQARGEAVAASARGSFLGKAFSGELRAGAIDDLVRSGRTPFGFDGRAAGVRARVSGELAPLGEADGPDLRFDVSAARARDIAPWLGLSADGDAPVKAQGRARAWRGRQSVSDLHLRIGASSARLDVTRTAAGGDALLDVRLAADTLDADELRRALGVSAEREITAVVDLPFLPTKLTLADADLDLRAARIDGLALPLGDARFRGRVRGGAMAPASLAFNAAGSAWKGTLALDARTAAPLASLSLTGAGVDVGALLRGLRLARDIDASAGRLAVTAQMRGASLGEALERSSLAATIESGRFALGDPELGVRVPVEVAHGALRAKPGQALTAELAGSLRGAPVTLRLETGTLRRFLDAEARLPFSLAAESDDLSLTLAGEAAPRAGRPDVDLTARFSGSRVDRLTPWLGVALPPWGPFAIAGRLRVSDAGYALDDFHLTVGESVLAGAGTLDTTRERPKLEAALRAEAIRIEDFDFGAWSPFEARTRERRGGVATQAREAVADVTARADAIVSGPVLRAIDADVEVVVERVLAGGASIGRGRAVASAHEGRARIGPVTVEAQDGGRAELYFGFLPGEQGLSTETRIRVDRFDYGFILRRAQPDTTASGRFSLEVDLEGVAPRPEEVIERGRGRIDFAIWPERQHARVLDFWVTNVLFAIIPIIRDAESELNCVVGQFDVAAGLVEPLFTVIDTTNTRATASGRIDLVAEEIDLRVEPRAKVPRVFSLATPFHITGTLDRLRLEVRNRDKLRTIALWPVSPIVAPIQRLTGTRPPPDGSDVCTDTKRRQSGRRVPD